MLCSQICGIRALPDFTPLLLPQKNLKRETCNPLAFSPFLTSSKKLSLISLWPFSFISPNWSTEAIFFFNMSFPFVAGSFRLRTNVAQHGILQGFDVLQLCFRLSIPKFYNYESCILGHFASRHVVSIEMERNDPEKVFNIKVFNTGLTMLIIYITFTIVLTNYQMQTLKTEGIIGHYTPHPKSKFMLLACGSTLRNFHHLSNTLQWLCWHYLVLCSRTAVHTIVH